ncbi:hypothetical protein EAH83_12285 [Variovorax ginsengisoli]|uniref:Uncharacterized protein n=1 Tax=Variovorax guangxiensis TaxID=1775474 RepID=A0A502DQ29_9BURK|nr:hypothetical protein EAH83_12285 [Variovorax ginsengisoli]TPG27487.1 hypothetical protein EAH82_11945 [Variovorax guangxiensis]
MTPFAVVLGPAAPSIGAFVGGVGGAFAGAQAVKSIGAYLTGGDTPDKLGPPLTLPNDIALEPTILTSDGSGYALVQIEDKYTWFSIQDNPALPNRYVEVVSGTKAAELTGSYLDAAGFGAQLAQRQAELAQQQREALRAAFARSEIESANHMGPNGLPWGTPSAIGSNATQTWLLSPDPGQTLNILDVRNADRSASRIVQEVDRNSGALLGEKNYENPVSSNPDGFRLVATSDHQNGVHWTLDRETGKMEQAGVAPAARNTPSFEEGFAPDGSPLGQAATVVHEGKASTTVWTRDATTGQYTETETSTRRDNAGKDTQAATIVRSYAADGTALQQQIQSPSAAPAMSNAEGHPNTAAPTQPEPISHITTHEQRITPTPGGMSFAEAHQRRDEPEQISTGSLQPVGKLAQPDRQHELTLLREIGIVNARVKEALGNAPKLREAGQPSLEHTQQRTQEPTQDLAPRHTLKEAVVQPVPSPEMKAVAPQTMAPAQPMQVLDQRVVAPAPSQTTTPSAPDSLEMHARLAAKEAELATARAQIARLSVQGFAVPQASEPATARAESAAPARQTDPRDPAHPDHKDFQKIFDVLAQDGRWNALQSTSIASQALADFKGDRLAKRLDVVLLEPDTRGQLKLFVGHAPWGGLRCLSVAAVDPVQVARVPPEQSFERLEQATQMAQQRELQDAQRWGQQSQQQQGNAPGPAR